MNDWKSEKLPIAIFERNFIYYFLNCFPVILTLHYCLFCYSFSVFSLFMRMHAQAMNEYRGGEMLMKVVIEWNLWTEVVDCRRKWKRPAQTWLHGRTFDFRVHRPSSRHMNELSLRALLFYFTMWFNFCFPITPLLVTALLDLVTANQFALLETSYGPLNLDTDNRTLLFAN